MRNPEKLCISVRALKAHQLYKTLRRLETNGTDWSQIYIQLSELLQEQVKKLQKSTIFPTLLFLLSYSVDFKTAEIIKIVGIPVSVPIAFSLFTASTWLFMLAMHSQTVIVILQTCNKVSEQLQKQGIDSSMLGFFHGKDDTALTQAYIPNLFFKTKWPVYALISASSFIGFCSVLLVLAPVWMFTLFQQYKLLFSDVGYVERIAAGAGLLVLVFSIIYLISFNLAVKYTKNTSHARWNFLASASGYSLHPQAEKWSDVSDKKRPKS